MDAAFNVSKNSCLLWLRFTLSGQEMALQPKEPGEDIPAKLAISVRPITTKKVIQVGQIDNGEQENIKIRDC